MMYNYKQPIAYIHIYMYIVQHMYKQRCPMYSTRRNLKNINEYYLNSVLTGATQLINISLLLWNNKRIAKTNNLVSPWRVYKIGIFKIY